MTSPAAIITGASVRVGRAVALHLAAAGYDLALHYHTSAEDALSLQREVRDMGRRAELFSADLRELDEVQAMADEIFAAFDHITLLVNNASRFQKGTIESPVSEFQDDLSIHLLSPLVLLQAFAKQVKSGQVINFLDSAIMDDGTEHFSYLLSKKSLADLTRMAAIDLAPQIRVNGIAPGPALPAPGATEAQLLKRAAQMPMRRSVSLEGILTGIDYLIHSPDVTGEILSIDGGQHLRRKS